MAARVLRIQATVLLVCQRCGPSQEHGYCASGGGYKCRKCGMYAAPSAPETDGLEPRLPLLDPEPRTEAPA